MELDKRIKALTDIQSVTNGNKGFIGKKGYFAENIGKFEDLSKCTYGVVNDYREDDKCFCHTRYFTNKANDSTWYPYFILEDDLKPVEKKYRPYSLEEFLKIFDVGDQIDFRYKDTDDVKHAMFTGYITDVDRIDDKTPGACEIMLGVFHYSLLDLFKDFERFYNGRWWPFGVEIQEE